MSTTTADALATREAVLLAALAHHIHGATVIPDHLVISAVVRVCSPIADEQARDEAWAEYLAAVEVEMAIEDGVLDWRDVDDTLTCDDRTTVAIEIAQDRAAEKLAALMERQS